MQLSEILDKTGGLKSIARELNLNESDAAKAAAALGPAVLGGFRKQAESHPQGLTGLGGMLSQLGGGGLLDSLLSPTPTDTAPGNNVLGQIFGSKDVSRTVFMAKGKATGTTTQAAPATGGGLGGLRVECSKAATATQLHAPPAEQEVSPRCST